MGWENVPWMVAGGAEHSAAVGRVVAYVGASGNEGIVGPDSCKVTPLGTPGAGIVVATGAAVIPCRAPNQAFQSYVGRVTSADTVGVSLATTAVRSDLVIGRVEDPYDDVGFTAPAAGSQANAPYMFSRVLTGVPSTAIASWAAARAYLIAQAISGVPLAGISQPTSNAAITAAQITDLRRVANPRRERRVYTVNPATAAPGIQLTSAATVDWFGSWQVDVPFWATRAVVLMNIGGVRHARLNSTTNGTAAGGVNPVFGATVVQGAAYDVETTATNNQMRFSISAGDTIPIASAVRGTTVTLKIQGYKTSAGNVPIGADVATFASVDVEFQEVAA